MKKNINIKSLVKQIEEKIESGSLSSEELKLLTKELNFYNGLHLKSPLTFIDKINSDLSIEGISLEQCSELVAMLDNFIVPELKFSYQERFYKNKKILKTGFEFFASLDDRHKNLVSFLKNNDIQLYKVDDNLSVSDICFYSHLLKLPFVQVRKEKSVLTFSKVVHEIEHQVNYMSNTKFHSSYLREMPSILIELLANDYFSVRFNDKEFLKNNYYRINDIMKLATNLRNYLKMLIYILEGNTNVKSDDFDLTVSVIKGTNIQVDLAIIHSFLVALHFRERYYVDKDEMFSDLSMLINFNFEKFDFLKMNDSGADSLKKYVKEFKFKA